MNALHDLPLGTIVPSKTNPRKDFTSPAAVTYLEELAATIRQKGVLQPILVRPGYCVGASTHATIDQRRAEVSAEPANEIICGECRWRASALAECATIPAVVREMTDDDAREAQVIENLQRRDITPFEEAEGFAEMLLLKTDDGLPRYTRETIAQKIGHEPDFVYKRLALLDLPQIGKEALQNGTLTAKTATLFGAIAPAMREDFAREILTPQLTEGPLSYRAAKDLRDAKFVRVLRGAPFSLDDAALLPSAGACAACPRMSANCPQLFDGDDNVHLKQRTCLNPQCYEAKLAALQQRQAAEAAQAGKTMLPPAEAEKVYPFFTATGEMDSKSPYVQITRKPAEHLLKREVTRVESWEKMIEAAEEKTGMKVPRVMIADQAGVVREHVEMKLAIAAIEKAGEPIFREAGPSGPPSSRAADPFAVQKREEAERAKMQWAITAASLTAVYGALVTSWKTHDLWSPATWDELFGIAMEASGDAGLGVVVKWLELKVDDGEFGRSDAVEKWWNGLTKPERDSAIAILLVAPGVKAHGVAAESLVNLARAQKVDLDALAKKVAAEFKAAAKAAKAPKLTAEQLKEKTRELLREKKTAGEIAVALAITEAKAQKLVGAIAKEEDAAKVTSDPKTLAEWVKAAAQGMSVEEIARSYQVPVADVVGALGSGAQKTICGLPEGKFIAVKTLLAAGKPKSKIVAQLEVSLPSVHLVAKHVAEEEKAAKQSVAAPAAKKPAGKTKPTPAAIEQRVREMRAAGKTFTDIFLATKMKERPLKKLLAQIDAEKKGAAAK